jgi:mannose-6-phosphate isomerase-like protein (cupin superfamily)
MTEPAARTPRLTYTSPTHIRAGAATPYRWGDESSGYVDDEVLISSPLLHSIIFTLSGYGSFVHSRANPTIFKADIVYVVLSGSLLLADPEHGQLLNVDPGDALFFRRDTWHDGFNRSADPVRVLELFSPTPAAGASSAYAKQQPFLEESRYGDDDAIGRWPDLAPALEAARRIHLSRPAERLLRLEGDVLWGLIASTEHLHAATGELTPQGTGPTRRYGGDAALHVTRGPVLATTHHDGSDETFEIASGDTLIVPEGGALGLQGGGSHAAEFILGVAPTYTEPGASG